MKTLTLALALLSPAAAAAQSWDAFLSQQQAAPLPWGRSSHGDEQLEAGLSAGLTLFDVGNHNFADGEGLGVIGNISVYGRGDDFGMVEVGFFAFGSRQEGTDNHFTAELLTLGGGYRWMVGATRLSMGTTAGLCYAFSSDFQSEDELHDGFYASFFSAAHISGPVGFYLRFTAIALGSSAKVDDEGLDWIIATTIGIDVAF